MSRETRRCAGDTNASLLCLLLASCMSDELENMSYNLERRSQLSRRVRIRRLRELPSERSHQTRRRKRVVELVLRVLVDQRSKIESPIMHDAQDSDKRT